MAASTVSRLVLRSLRVTAVSLRQRSLNAAPNRSFSASSIVLGKKWFTEKHEWIEFPDGGKQGVVGITDYAQDNLGEIVYVELPEVGAALEKDEPAGILESVKAASDIFCPVGGTVTEVNETLKDTPSLINKSPLDEGWLFKLDVPDQKEVETLMDEEAYKKLLEEQ